MTQFGSDFQDFAAPLMAEQHGEQIWYYPDRSDPFQVWAHRVDRLPVANVGGTMLPTYPIIIAISQKLLAVVRVGVDKVALLRRVDDQQATTMTIREILSSDGGSWELALS